MKKIKFNIMAVAAMAIAFSTFAFKASEEKKTDLVWFEITGSYAPGAPIPTASANYLNHGSSPENTSNCDGSNNQCVSGFDAQDVDASNNLIGTPIPLDYTRTKK